jgi:hypothetical protein
MLRERWCDVVLVVGKQENHQGHMGDDPGENGQEISKTPGSYSAITFI